MQARRAGDQGPGGECQRAHAPGERPETQGIGGPADDGGEHEHVARRRSPSMATPRDATTSSTPSVAMASAHFCRAVICSKPSIPAATVTTVGMLARMRELLVAVVRYEPGHEAELVDRVADDTECDERQPGGPRRQPPAFLARRGRSHISTDPSANRTAVKARGEMSANASLVAVKLPPQMSTTRRRPRAGVVSGI